MKRFLVTYLAPSSVIADWKKTDPEKRKAAGEKMQNDWKKWMGDHHAIFVIEAPAWVRRGALPRTAALMEKMTSCCMGSSRRKPTKPHQECSKIIRIWAFRALP